jgi:hypothetical protein
MTTFALLLIGYAAGAVSMALAILVGQWLRGIQPSEDEHPPVFRWMDEREEYDRRVAENRRLAASDPHGLQIVRDGFDREQEHQGGTPW